jgi:hypothetical protein
MKNAHIGVTCIELEERREFTVHILIEFILESVVILKQ